MDGNSSNSKEKLAGSESAVIGVHVGYMDCCVAVWKEEQNRAEVIPDHDGRRITPNYVAFTHDSQILVGQDAFDQSLSNWKNTIFASNFLAGQKYSEIGEGNAKFAKGKNDESLVVVKYEGERKLYQPQLLFAILLTRLKDYAEKYLARPINNVVFTINPSTGYDTSGRIRKATEEAASLVGLNVVGFVGESMAAASAYGSMQSKAKCGEKRKLLMLNIDYKFWTTTDIIVSIVEIRHSVVQTKAQVRGCNVGTRFSSKMFGYIKGRFDSKYKEDLPNYEVMFVRMREISDEINKKFFAEGASSTPIQIPALYKGLDFSETITRSTFEEINKDFFENLMNPVRECLEKANMVRSEIDQVLLVGDYSRFAKVRDLLDDFFQGKVLVSQSMDPNEMLAIGAAIHGAKIVREDLPTGSRLNDLDFMDVTPMSLGVENKCGIMDVIVKKGTPFPVKKKKRYTTCRDDQTTITFQVYAGEEPIAQDNCLLGHFHHTCIDPAPAGDPELEVSFDVDRNGMLQVTTFDSKSGRTAAFRPDGLNKEDINKMIQEEESLESDCEAKIKRLMLLSVNLAEVEERGESIHEPENTGIIGDNVDVGVEMPDGPVLGIDLGTSNSCVSVWDNKDVMIIIDDQGNRVIPSYVAFTEEDDILFGVSAKSEIKFNPQNTIFGTKRFIGRKFNDESLQSDITSWPFQVVKRDDEEIEMVVEYKGEEKHLSPQNILSIVLQNLKELAEKMLNQKPIQDVVLTVPVYFHQSQRTTITKAAEAAGLKIHRFINEPTAAAVAYAFKYNSSMEKTVLVFDLGGGTLDVSLLSLQNSIVVVKGMDGDSHLGGEDFDQRLVRHFCNIFYDKHHVNITDNKRAVGKLRKECEEAKKRLCVKNEIYYFTRVEVECLYNRIDFSETLYLQKFEELNNDLFEKCMEPVKRCLDKSGLTIDDVDEVILVGGSSQIPKIRELLREFFQRERLFDSLQPEEVVATGAAIIGAKLGGQKEESIVEFNLKDVTPASLGLVMNDGRMKIVVPRNTTIPVRKHILLPLLQLPKTLAVYEGEKELAEDNLLLGELQFSTTSHSSQGVTCVLEVSFYVDMNNVVQVTAKHAKSTGIIAKETFSDNKGRLQIDEIAEMIRENEKISLNHMETQEKLKALNELKELSDSLIIKLEDEKVKANLGEFVNGELNSAVSNATRWLDVEGRKAEVEAIVKKKEGLQFLIRPFEKDIGLRRI